MLELDLRFYKRYDVDLIALHKAGAPLGEYIKMALAAYTTGKPFHIFIPFAPDHSFDDRQLLHTSVKIDDPATERMLLQIKHGYRNSFCKLILRDAIIFQNLSIYSSDPGYRRMERERIARIDPAEIPGTIIATLNQTTTKNTAEKILKKAGSKSRTNTPSAKKDKPVPVVNAPKPEKPIPVIEPVGADGSSDSSEDLLSIFQGMMQNT